MSPCCYREGLGYESMLQQRRVLFSVHAVTGKGETMSPCCDRGGLCY